MLYVTIALLPASAFGVWNFGVSALVMLVCTTASAVLTEYIYEKLMHKKITINDYSAVVTGLLLGLNMPASAPWWMGVLGGIFAILIVKQLFGGLGQNIMNPALGARCFLLISFTGSMTAFTYDGVSTATPLALLKSGEQLDVTVMDMLIGKTAGTIGETSAIAVVIGAIFLILMGIIDLRIPGTYIATFVVFIGIFGQFANPEVGFFDPQYITAHLCGGGLMLGAWFMATDYVTSPITKKGQLVYGALLGILTGLFRLFGGSAIIPENGRTDHIVILIQNHQSVHLPAEADTRHPALVPPAGELSDSGHGLLIPVLRLLLRPARMRKIQRIFPRYNIYDLSFPVHQQQFHR